MAELYLLRHYPTEWNQARRIQGRTDIPLARQSVERLRSLTLSPKWQTCHWVSSPLLRCRQTAEAFGIKQFATEASLQEMDWGEFEGVTLGEIEAQITARDIRPATGLDFRPPGGESPREVCSRLQSWLDQPKNPCTVAVTHKGVIRAALSLATGWDMEAPFKQHTNDRSFGKIDWSLPLRFEISASGRLQLLETNVRQWNADFAG